MCRCHYTTIGYYRYPALRGKWKKAGAWVMDSMDEHELLRQIANRDQMAFQKLYAVYHARLWRYVWHQLDGNSAWVEEVLQDIFMSIWHSAENFRGNAKVATWIFRIAHFQVSKAWRIQGRRAEGHLAFVSNLREEDIDEQNWSDVSLEEVTINRLTLIDAISTLSPKQQATIDLVYIQGFTCDEVAHILDVPLGTVKSRIINARRTLLKHLETSQIVESPCYEV
jgi:RNA polymerase sigma-70 factor, ECF subfamily